MFSGRFVMLKIFPRKNNPSAYGRNIPTCTVIVWCLPMSLWFWSMRWGGARRRVDIPNPKPMPSQCAGHNGNGVDPAPSSPSYTISKMKTLRLSVCRNGNGDKIASSVIRMKIKMPMLRLPLHCRPLPTADAPMPISSRQIEVYSSIADFFPPNIYWHLWP